MRVDFACSVASSVECRVQATSCGRWVKPRTRRLQRRNPMLVFIMVNDGDGDGGDDYDESYPELCW